MLDEQITDISEPIVAADAGRTAGGVRALRDTAVGDRQAKRRSKAEVIAATPANDVEVTMAWSTYANGRWSAKRLSTNGAGPVATNFVPKDFYFTGWVSSADSSISRSR